MNQFSRLAALLVALACFVCGCNDWRKVEKLQAEVEAIHDVPMQKMDELETLKTAAVHLFIETDSTKTARRDSLRVFIREAEKAHELMFDWMAQYRTPDKKTMTDKEAIVYLNNQKNSAIEMSNSVLNAVETGRKLTR